MNQVQLPARFANRQQKRNLTTAVTAGLGTASPPYVSIMGGAFTLVDAHGEEVPVDTRHLDVVIIDVQRPDQGEAAISRVFWGLDDKGQPKGYDQGSKLPPECWSDNGIGASASATHPQSPSCQTCPMSRFDWVSKRDATKRTAACAKIKKIAVLPVEGTVGADGTYVPKLVRQFPFLLRVPIMSHENMRAYSDKFRGQDFDVSEVVTRITFVHGQVGQLDFAAAGFTDEATEATVQKFLDAHMTDVLVGRGDRVWNGAALPAPEQNRQLSRETIPAQLGPAPAPQAPTPFAPQEPVGEGPKRTRRTKAQMEADAAAQAPQQTQQAPADQSGIPPFLQRQASAAPFLQRQASAAPFQQPAAQQAQPTHGIAPAPAPNAELESALANVFGLKT